MANLNTMYPGVANSPDTYLREPLASGGSILYVVDGLVFGTLPTFAVIGDDHTAETVLITAKRADDGYDITRAIEGNAKDWIKGTTVARNFTNKDYKALVDNINVLNTEKLEDTSAVGNNVVSFSAATSRTNIISGNTLSVTFGKIAKWFADLKTVAWTGLLSDLTQTASYRTVTDTEKATWNGKQDAMSAGTNVTISNNTISATDTVYTHPASHPATMITESSTKRFVSDTEKSIWNGKADNTLASASANGLMSSAMWTKLNGLYNIVYLTEAAYTALTTKDANTLYLRPKA